MKKLDLDNFYNAGFGWVCKQCEKRNFVQNREIAQKPRLMTEGETESKTPQLSNSSMAKWANWERETLICPCCLIEENVTT